MGLTKKQKYSYGIGGLGKDLVYSLVATYFMFFLTDIKGVSTVFTGMLLFAARIWDAVNDPMMGMIVDNTHTKYGKFRPWIFIGTLINSVILILMFAKTGLTGTALNVYIAVFYILWGMTYTLMDIPYWSFVPALTSTEEERNIMSTIPRVFASFGYFIASSCTLVFVNNFAVAKLGTDQETGFFMLAILVAIIFMITSSITVFNVHEKEVEIEKKTFKLREIFTTIGRNDQLVAIFGTVALYTTALNLTSGLGIYYFKYDVGNENLFSSFTIIVGVAQVLAMLLFPKVAEKFPRRKVFITACILPIIGYTGMLIIAKFLGSSFMLLSFAGAFVFFGFGFSQVLATAMLADAVDYGEYKLGYRSESIVFSMQTFIVKLATGLQAIIVGIGLKVIGFKANEVQSASTIEGMRFMMFIIPIILLVLALIVYVRRYKLNGEYREKIMAELEERRERAIIE